MTNAGSPSFDPWPNVDVHVESTITGARQAALRGDIVVIVDVLSFSTTIGIAVDRGAEVLVYSADEIEARGGRQAVARELEAEIIAKGRVADGERFTLSPASLGAIGPGDRVIFTSWNGAACVAAASDDDVSAPAVLIGALGNRSAVADAVEALLAELTPATGRRVRCSIIAASEHWSSTVPAASGIRLAVEDLLGAGAIAEVLAERGLELSIEATMAAATFAAGRDDIAGILRRCVGGRELIARGFADDVEIAAALDSRVSVPCWRPGEPLRTFGQRRPPAS